MVGGHHMSGGGCLSSEGSLLTKRVQVLMFQCRLPAARAIFAVLYSAPPIPAGIWSFQWNSGGILQESSHSSGIPVESIGIPLE